MPKDMPSEFDAYDRTYSETVNRALAFSGMTVDFFTRVKVEYFIDLIESLRRPATDAEVLDVGCGIANSHPLLAGRIGRLAGVDVSRACIARASEANPDNEYKIYDGHNLPYDDGSFDVASAVCVFHHIPIAQQLPLAREIRRVLRQGGLCVIFEHNPFNPLTRHVVNKCEFDKDAVLLRSQRAEILLHEAGFRDIVSRYILTLPAAGFALRAIDKVFSRLPFGAQYFSVGRA